MSDRFIIEFFEGGTDLMDNVLTLGAASVIEKGLDTATGNDNHGWYCKITDKITSLKEERWGITKNEAQEKAMYHLQHKIEEYEWKKNKDEEQAEIDAEKVRILRGKQNRYNSTAPTSDSEAMVAFGKLAGILIGFLIVLYVAFVILFTAFLLLPTIAIGLVFWKKQWRTQLLWVSVVAMLYLFVDQNMSWLFKSYHDQFTFMSGIEKYFNYLNIVAGSVAVFYLIEEKYLEKISNTNSDTYQKHRKYAIAGVIGFGVILVALLFFNIRNLLFPFKESSNSNYVENQIIPKNLSIVGNWYNDKGQTINIADQGTKNHLHLLTTNFLGESTTGELNNGIIRCKTDCSGDSPPGTTYCDFIVNIVDQNHIKVTSTSYEYSCENETFIKK